MASQEEEQLWKVGAEFSWCSADLMNDLATFSERFGVESFFDPTLGAVVLYADKHLLGSAQSELEKILAYHADGSPVHFGEEPCLVTAKDHRRTWLRVSERSGAGLWLDWSSDGFQVSKLETPPGQPGLAAYDVIVSISGCSLCGLPDEEAANNVFGSHLKHGAEILIRRGAPSGAEHDNDEDAEAMLAKAARKAERREKRAQEAEEREQQRAARHEAQRRERDYRERRIKELAEMPGPVELPVKAPNNFSLGNLAFIIALVALTVGCWLYAP